MKAIDIPAKFPIPWAQNAGPGFIRPIPTSSQIGITPGAASLNDGYPPLNFTPVAAGGIPPFGQDSNGILFQSTSWDRWLSAGAPLKWDATFSSNIGGYPQGAVVASLTNLGMFFISQADDNPTNPDSGGANWVRFTPVSLYALDSGTANAMVATLFPTPPSLASLTGFPIRIKKLVTNTGPVTINLNGLGVTSIVHADGTALVVGELPGSGIVSIVYDGAVFQLQSSLATSITPAQLQTQPGNFAVDTGTADAMVAALSPAPANLAAMLGSAIRIDKMASPNTGACTLNLNSFGAQNIRHADGTAMAAGELPGGGMIELGWDGANWILLSPPIALPVPATNAQAQAATNNTAFITPQKVKDSQFGIKGWVCFHYTGGVLTTTGKSDTVNNVSRTGTGIYTITMTGGLTYVIGGALAQGGGGGSGGPAAAGFIGSGASFTGTNPTFTIRFGDSGGSGGELSDPTDATVIIFGLTNNS